MLLVYLCVRLFLNTFIRHSITLKDWRFFFCMEIIQECDCVWITCVWEVFQDVDFCMIMKLILGKVSTMQQWYRQHLSMCTLCLWNFYWLRTLWSISLSVSVRSGQIPGLSVLRLSGCSLLIKTQTAIWVNAKLVWSGSV